MIDQQRTELGGAADGGEDATDLGLRRADFAQRTEHLRRGPVRLAVLPFIWAGGRNIESALQEGLTVFSAAEQAGYEIAFTLVRHFQHFLASGPIAFLSAAAQRTSRIRIGTGVIPFHAEDPIRLAEELATLDALSGGRVEAGVAPTLHPRGFETRWSSQPESKESVWEKIGEFLGHLEGRPFPLTAGDGPRRSDRHSEVDPPAVTPHRPGLRDRIWGGPGSLASVAKTAEHRLNLQLSALTTEEAGRRVEPQQYEQIARFRTRSAQLWPGLARSVAVGRYIWPLTGGRDDDAVRALIRTIPDTRLADGRPTALAPRSIVARRTHPAHGSVDAVIEHLRSDIALAASDYLIVYLREELTVEQKVRQLEFIAKEIAPAL